MMSDELSDCQLCGASLDSLFDDEVMHRECSLRSVMGGIGHLIAHDYWCTERHDPDAGLTYRQSALLVDVFVMVVGVDEAARRAERADEPPSDSQDVGSGPPETPPYGQSHRHGKASRTGHRLVVEHARGVVDAAFVEIATGDPRPRVDAIEALRLALRSLDRAADG